MVAGWFSVRSIARRGPAGFARSRLVRLGVPILVFVALVEPLTDYLGNIWDESHGFGYYIGTTELSVMWFAAALLVFSLVYATWEHVHPTAPSPGPLRPFTLVVAVVTIAVSSFLVWLVWPLDGEMFLNLRVPEWPQGAVLFAVGVHAGRSGWLVDLRRDVVRRLGWMTVAGMVALVDAARRRVLTGRGAVDSGGLADRAVRAVRRRDRRGHDALAGCLHPTSVARSRPVARQGGTSLVCHLLPASARSDDV